MSSATLMLSRPMAVNVYYHRPTRIAKREITLRQPPARNRARLVECVPPLIESTTVRQAQQRRGNGGINVGATDTAGHPPCATANYFVDGPGKRRHASSLGL